MEKTILRGDHFLVDKAAFGIRMPFVSLPPLRPRDPKPHDLVVFHYPDDPTRLFVQRVIGIPHDKVEIRGLTVRVNDRPMSEPFAYFLAPKDDGARDWGPETVPADHVFVMGDNRDNSRDSRIWGFLPTTHVVGMAKVVYFSWDAHEGRVRWERIGLPLR
jgi:signal peptidase I